MKSVFLTVAQSNVECGDVETFVSLEDARRKAEEGAEANGEKFHVFQIVGTVQSVTKTEWDE